MGIRFSHLSPQGYTVFLLGETAFGLCSEAIQQAISESGRVNGRRAPMANLPPGQFVE